MLGLPVDYVRLSGGTGPATWEPWPQWADAEEALRSGSELWGAT